MFVSQAVTTERLEFAVSHAEADCLKDCDLVAQSQAAKDRYFELGLQTLGHRVGHWVNFMHRCSHIKEPITEGGTAFGLPVLNRLPIQLSVEEVPKRLRVWMDAKFNHAVHGDFCRAYSFTLNTISSGWQDQTLNARPLRACSKVPLFGFASSTCLLLRCSSENAPRSAFDRCRQRLVERGESC